MGSIGSRQGEMNVMDERRQTQVDRLEDAARLAELGAAYITSNILE